MSKEISCLRSKEQGDYFTLCILKFEFFTGCELCRFSNKSSFDFQFSIASIWISLGIFLILIRSKINIFAICFLCTKKKTLGSYFGIRFSMNIFVQVQVIWNRISSNKTIKVSNHKLKWTTLDTAKRDSYSKTLRWYDRVWLIFQILI